jgi:gas vesicle protein
MTSDTRDRNDHGFLIGLLTGTAVGAGLAILFAPRSGAELRQRVAESAKQLSNRAADRYQQVSTRVDETVHDLTTKSARVRDDVADAVARGAREVERIATAAKVEHAGESRKHSAADKTHKQRDDA